MQDLFVDKETSLHTLAKVIRDSVLLSEVSNKSEVHLYMAEHPVMRKLDHDEFLLRLAVGQSDTDISRRFLVDRWEVAEMRHDLEKRYQTMFQWLNGFCRMARVKGYAENGDSQKYIDGLMSSDIARREQALEYAVRWLIRYLSRGVSCM